MHVLHFFSCRNIPNFLFDEKKINLAGILLLIVSCNLFFKLQIVSKAKKMKIEISMIWNLLCSIFYKTKKGIVDFHSIAFDQGHKFEIIFDVDQMVAKIWGTFYTFTFRFWATPVWGFQWGPGPPIFWKNILKSQKKGTLKFSSHYLGLLNNYSVAHAVLFKYLFTQPSQYWQLTLFFILFWSQHYWVLNTIK